MDCTKGTIDIQMIKETSRRKVITLDNMTTKNSDFFYMLIRVNGVKYRFDLYPETNILKLGKDDRKKVAGCPKFDIFDVHESRILNRLIMEIEMSMTIPIKKQVSGVNIYTIIDGDFIEISFNNPSDYEDQTIRCTKEEVEEIIKMLKVFDGIIRTKAYI